VFSFDKSDKFAKFGLPFNAPSAKFQVYSQMKDHQGVRLWFLIMEGTGMKAHV